jgi:hypothetical protein
VVCLLVAGAGLNRGGTAEGVALDEAAVPLPRVGVRLHQGAEFGDDTLALTDVEAFPEPLEAGLPGVAEQRLLLFTQLRVLKVRRGPVEALQFRLLPPCVSAAQEPGESVTHRGPSVGTGRLQDSCRHQACHVVEHAPLLQTYLPFLTVACLGVQVVEKIGVLREGCDASSSPKAGQEPRAELSCHPVRYASGGPGPPGVGRRWVSRASCGVRASRPVLACGGEVEGAAGTQAAEGGTASVAPMASAGSG